MPNHIHGIIAITVLEESIERANSHSPLQMRPRSVSSFVVGFKATVTKRINILRNTPKSPVWQRNYYEHVIRNENELKEIRDYIVNNPLDWESDEDNPKNK